MREAKYALTGTPDQLKTEFDALKTLGGEGRLAWFFDQGAMRGRRRCARWRSFAEHIIPAFAERRAHLDGALLLSRVICLLL